MKCLSRSPSPKTSMEPEVNEPKPRLSHLLSSISNPLYLSPPVILAVSLRYSSSVAAAFYWWGLYLIFSTVLPLADLIWRRKTGRISDWHISNREERKWPLVFGMLYAASGFVIFRLLSGPRILQACLLSGLAMSLIVLFITSFWKISLHLLGNASLVTILYLAFDLAPLGPASLIMALYLLAVALSRLLVKAHTPAQVIAGALMGGAVTWLIFTVMGVA